jgi:hypothetical protein
MTITLTFQGVGSGSVTPAGATKPVPFSNSAFTFSFTTDTTLISKSGAVFNTPFVTGGIVHIGGMSGTFSVPVSAQINSPWVNFIVQLTSSSSAAVVGGSSTSFAGYNPQSAIGPLTLSAPDVNIDPRSVPTSFGSFILTKVSSETFTIVGAYYFIKSKLNGNVIDILGGSTRSGAGLDAYPQKSTGTDNQLWEFVSDPAGSGYYFIKSKLDGNVIDIEGGSTKAGALLDAYPQKTTGTDNQLWEFVSDPAGSGYYFIVSKLNGNVIDIQGASTTAGALLDAYPLKAEATGYDNQLWTVVGGAFPSVVSTVPAPSGGLGSDYNYLLDSNCNSLIGLSVKINVFTNIVGSDGFGFQLNAYSAKSDYDAAQQYLIFLDPHSSPPQLYCMVDNWTASNTQIINHIVPLATLPSQELPAGYQLVISLDNDASGKITGATYSAFDNTGKSLGSQTITLLSLSGVTSADLAPIVAFQLDFVDYLNGGITTLSSGAGAITYTASNKMTPLSAAPSCVDWNYITVERANSVYGVLPSNANQTFTQFFQASAAAISAVTPKPGTVLHKTSRQP